MTAGRELDVLIAEKVMGWYYTKHPCPEKLFPHVKPSPSFFPSYFKWTPEKEEKHPGIGNGIACPKYSTDISAAWEVVEKINQREIQVIIKNTVDGYNVELKSELNSLCYQDAISAPLAICLAALKVVENK